MPQAGARPLDVPLPASTWAIFVDGMDEGAKDLAGLETLIKPSNGRNVG
jgi:hypothetical protein